MAIPKELVELADLVRAGTTPIITPRNLITWFGAQRRGVWISARVKEALDHLGLSSVRKILLTRGERFLGPSAADLSDLRKWVSLLQKLSNLGVI